MHCARILLLAYAALLPVVGQPGSDIVKHVYPSRNALAAMSSAPTAQAPTAGNGITYHGGPVMLGTPNVYFIWYGNWAADPTGVSILQHFVQNEGGSPYYGINTTYYNAAATPISNSIKYALSYNDNYSRGKNLADSDVQAIVSAAITGGHLPSDSNGIYFVLTWQDVTETSGFVTKYCGWHTRATIGAADIKFAFIGDAATQGLSSCASQTSSSPNGDPAIDAMVSVVAHELEETTSDPDLNAWFDASGNENADKCAYTYGNYYTSSNGSIANMNLGGYDFLVQQNWVNAAGGYCALTLGSSGNYTPLTWTSLTSATQQANGGITANADGSGWHTATATQTMASGGGAIQFVPNPAALSSGSGVYLTLSTGSTNSYVVHIGQYNSQPCILEIYYNGTWQSFTPYAVGQTPTLSLSVSSSGVVTVNSGTAVVYTFAAANSTWPLKTSWATAIDNAGLTSASLVGSGGSSTPSITQLSPSTGSIGTAVTITGTNLGSSGTVTFNGVSATATSWNATSIAVSVPTGASTGNVVVTVGGVASNALPFTVQTQSTLTPLTWTSLTSATQQSNGGVTANADGSGWHTATATQTMASGGGAIQFVPNPAALSSGSGVYLTLSTGSTNSYVVHIGQYNSQPCILEIYYNGTWQSFTPYAVGQTPTLSLSVSSSGVVTVNSGTAVVYTFAAANSTWPLKTSWATAIDNAGLTSASLVGSGGSSTPSITQLSPSTGSIGTAVTITGTNLGSSGTVTFNGVSATATSWNATSIAVSVPTGASTGNVVVTVGGVASNALPFTVQTQSTLTPLTWTSLTSATQQANGGITANADGSGWHTATATQTMASGGGAIQFVPNPAALSSGSGVYLTLSTGSANSYVVHIGQYNSQPCILEIYYNGTWQSFTPYAVGQTPTLSFSVSSSGVVTVNSGTAVVYTFAAANSTWPLKTSLTTAIDNAGLTSAYLVQ